MAAARRSLVAHIASPAELDAAIEAAGTQPFVLGCFAGRAEAEEAFGDLALLAPGVSFGCMTFRGDGGLPAGTAGAAPAAMFARLRVTAAEAQSRGGVAIVFAHGDVVHRGPADLNELLPPLAALYCTCLRAVGTPAALAVSQAPGDKLLRQVKAMPDVDSATAEHPLVVVDFTAPWCRPCGRLKPVYEALARLVPGVLFATSNVDVAEDVKEAFRVGPIPALLVLRNGKQVAPLDLGADICKVVHTLGAAHRRVYAERPRP